MDRSHNPEFTMLEVYVAYKDYTWMMEFVENMICAAARAVNGITTVSRGDTSIDFAPPLQRISMHDAIERYAGRSIQGKSELELRAIAKELNVEVSPTDGAGKIIAEIFTEYGNNIRLCRLLGVRDPQRFGRYHGIKIGYAGTFGTPVHLSRLAERLRSGLGSPCRILRFGKGTVRSIGIVSGGGGGMMKDAWEAKLDCLLVGEIDLASYIAAREYGMNVLAAGHYATETAGVRALMPLVRNAFGVETVFLDDPKDQ